MERLWRPEGVNNSKGRVRVECVERSHVAAENIGEHQRMLGMKFYVTGTSENKRWHSHASQERKREREVSRQQTGQTRSSTHKLSQRQSNRGQ